jgi:hypothetical protein
VQTIVPLSLRDRDAEDDLGEELGPVAIKDIGHVVWSESITWDASRQVAGRILIDHVGTKVDLRQARFSQRRVDRGDIDINELQAWAWYQRSAVDDGRDVKVTCPSYVLPGHVGDL